MNKINEIGDTPKGQYMLGRLSQRYGEPNLYYDTYDKKPKIADYASKNWRGYSRGHDNETAFDLGKGDEANTKWVDDGKQRKFRKMHNLPQLENKDNNAIYNMNKKLIRLTESDLHNIVKESVHKILNETYTDGGYEQIDLDCSASTDDGINGRVRAANLWFQNEEITVRWVDENGADSTSNLLEDNPSMIWNILKSIKN